MHTLMRGAINAEAIEVIDARQKAAKCTLINVMVLLYRSMSSREAQHRIGNVEPESYLSTINSTHEHEREPLDLSKVAFGGDR